MAVLDHLRGLVLPFNEVRSDGNTRVAPGAVVNGPRIALDVCHFTTPEATRADGLDVWSDSTGVWLQVPVPSTPTGCGLYRKIAAGEWRAMSSLLDVDTAREDVVDGRRLVTITRARLQRVSVVEEGAYPSARCWLASEDEHAVGDVAVLWRWSRVVRQAQLAVGRALLAKAAA